MRLAQPSLSYRPYLPGNNENQIHNIQSLTLHAPPRAQKPTGPRWTHQLTTDFVPASPPPPSPSLPLNHLSISCCYSGQQSRKAASAEHPLLTRPAADNQPVRVFGTSPPPFLASPQLKKYSTKPLWRKMLPEPPTHLQPRDPPPSLRTDVPSRARPCCNCE